MKRREFLLLTAMSSAMVSVPFVECKSRNKELDKTLSIPQMLAHITDTKTVQQIGKEYGDKIPEEYKISKLENLLTNNNTNMSSAALQTQLINQSKADFQQNKTVVLNGWILSVTEARQCALYSLTS